MTERKRGARALKVPGFTAIYLSKSDVSAGLQADVASQGLSDTPRRQRSRCPTILRMMRPGQVFLVKGVASRMIWAAKGEHALPPPVLCSFTLQLVQLLNSCPAAAILHKA